MISDTEKALDELAALVQGGGFGGKSLLETLGAVVWIRVNGASGQFKWLPDQRVRLTCVSCFNVGQTVVVSRAPFDANTLNQIPNGGVMNDNVIIYYPTAAGGTVPLTQFRDLWEHVGHDDNDCLYVTWTSSTQGHITLHYVILGPR